MSLFITFEGCDGFGKSSQAKILADRLAVNGYQVLLTQEPGGTELGIEITRLLKWSRHATIGPLAELMLFNASRAELVNTVIKPALVAGKIVVCDRYIDSTVVYQGYGRSLSLSTVKAVNAIASQGLIPDLTILLDMPVEKGQERKHLQQADRFEQEKFDFHQKVRDGYLALAQEEPSRWLIINAAQPLQKIADTIWEQVKTRIDSGNVTS